MSHSQSYIMTASTLSTEHCFVSNAMQECPMLYVCHNSVACGRDKALSHRHRSVPLWKWSPRVILLSACWIGPMNPNWILRYQAETYSKEDMSGTWYHCAIQKTVQGYRKWQKVANNGLVGGWMLLVWYPNPQAPPLMHPTKVSLVTIRHFARPCDISVWNVEQPITVQLETARLWQHYHVYNVP